MPEGDSATNRSAAVVRDTPETSRKLVVGVVTLAVLLSALGLVLALQQSELLVAGRVAELRPEAYRRVSSVNRAAATEIERTFASIGLHGCRGAERSFRPSWPSVWGSSGEDRSWLCLRGSGSEPWRPS